ncbi:MAG: hypothetical protein EOL95_09170, partial [Bacteroidia bacterium]|nr:hypothetical protein [Bacteroidia bacterium]
MTREEFAKKIKAKYPAYNDMDDLELARKTLAKYPVYRETLNVEPEDSNLKKWNDYFFKNKGKDTEITQKNPSIVNMPEQNAGIQVNTAPINSAINTNNIKQNTPVIPNKQPEVSIGEKPKTFSANYKEQSSVGEIAGKILKPVIEPLSQGLATITSGARAFTNILAGVTGEALNMIMPGEKAKFGAVMDEADRYAKDAIMGSMPSTREKIKADTEELKNLGELLSSYNNKMGIGITSKGSEDTYNNLVDQYYNKQAELSEFVKQSSYSKSLDEAMRDYQINSGVTVDKDGNIQGLGLEQIITLTNMAVWNVYGDILLSPLLLKGAKVLKNLVAYKKVGQATTGLNGKVVSNTFGKVGKATVSKDIYGSAKTVELMNIGGTKRVTMTKSGNSIIIKGYLKRGVGLGGESQKTLLNALESSFGKKAGISISNGNIIIDPTTYGISKFNTGSFNAVAKNITASIGKVNPYVGMTEPEIKIEKNNAYSTEKMAFILNRNRSKGTKVKNGEIITPIKDVRQNLGAIMEDLTADEINGMIVSNKPVEDLKMYVDEKAKVYYNTYNNMISDADKKGIKIDGDMIIKDIKNDVLYKNVENLVIEGLKEEMISIKDNGEFYTEVDKFKKEVEALNSINADLRVISGQLSPARAHSIVQDSNKTYITWETNPTNLSKARADEQKRILKQVGDLTRVYLRRIMDEFTNGIFTEIAQKRASYTGINALLNDITAKAEIQQTSKEVGEKLPLIGRLLKNIGVGDILFANPRRAGLKTVVNLANSRVDVPDEINADFKEALKKWTVKDKVEQRRPYKPMNVPLRIPQKSSYKEPVIITPFTGLTEADKLNLNTKIGYNKPEVIKKKSLLDLAKKSKTREEFADKVVENWDEYKDEYNKIQKDISKDEKVIDIIWDKSKKVIKTSEKAIKDPNKYETVNDYIKAYGKPLYHGTNAGKEIEKTGFKNLPPIHGKQIMGKGIYLTPTKKEASNFGAEVLEVYVDPSVKILDITPATHWSIMQEANEKYKNIDVEEAISKLLTEKGYGGLKMINAGNKGETYISIFNPDKLKTKSQLIDIWNKANKIATTRADLLEEA